MKHDHESGDRVRLYIEEVKLMPEGMVQPPSLSPPKSLEDKEEAAEGSDGTDEHLSEDAEEEDLDDEDPGIRSIKEEQRR